MMIKICRLLLIIVFLNSGFAMGWSCPRGEFYFKDFVYEKYSSSDVVLILKPYKIEVVDLGHEFSSYKLIHGQVLKQWKGPRMENIVVKDFKSAISGYIPFFEEQEYLVYADGPERDGLYETNVCSVEEIDHIDKRHTSILNKIKSKTFVLGKYHKLSDRIQKFLSYDVVDEINFEEKEKSIRVIITLQEEVDAWVPKTIVRFIESESISLGVSNLGKLEVKNSDQKYKVLWEHPKD